jgi:hypothetical protein
MVTSKTAGQSFIKSRIHNYRTMHHSAPKYYLRDMKTLRQPLKDSCMNVHSSCNSKQLQTRNNPKAQINQLVSRQTGFVQYSNRGMCYRSMQHWQISKQAE